MAPSTNAKHNAEFKRFLAQFGTRDFIRKVRTFFDIKTGYYCVKTDIYESEDSLRSTTSLYKYFETFEELGEYLNYDFSNCDFTDAFDLSEENISNYNENTKFPIKSENQLNKIISSGYDRTKNKFYVKATFHSKQQTPCCSTSKEFKYFFEFVAFLNYDLTDSNLIFCEGLKNLTDCSNLNIQKAKVVSSIKANAGVLIESPVLKIEAKNYENVEKNENESNLILQNSRTELSEIETLINDDKIYYITDLHLEHRLNHAGCKTNEDCVYAIQKIIDGLLLGIEFGKKELLLIGGDTASSFWIFELFVKMLKSSIKSSSLSSFLLLIFSNCIAPLTILKTLSFN
jgi:hypothetical protein